MKERHLLRNVKHEMKKASSSKLDLEESKNAAIDKTTGKNQAKSTSGGWKSRRSSISRLPCSYISSYTVQALYKNPLYKKMRGLIFLPHICFVEYIYMQVEVKELRDHGILKAKKFRCMWRSPFAPLLIFYLEREMEPASLVTKYPPKWSKMNIAQPRQGWEWQAAAWTSPSSNHDTVTNARGNSSSQTPATLLALPFLLCLALPCLAALLPP